MDLDQRDDHSNHSPRREYTRIDTFSDKALKRRYKSHLLCESFLIVYLWRHWHLAPGINEDLMTESSRCYRGDDKGLCPVPVAGLMGLVGAFGF